MVGGKKISGILLESESTGDNRVSWVIIGVGINIETHPDKINSELEATSIAAEGGDALIEKMLSTIMGRFDAGFNEWQELGFVPVRGRGLNGRMVWAKK